jgi:hypothetical protein
MTVIEILALNAAGIGIWRPMDGIGIGIEIGIANGE